MKHINSVIVSGVLNNNPEKQDNFVSFDIANNISDNLFIPVHTYGTLSIWCIENLRKGIYISITGRIKEDDGLFIEAVHITDR